MTKMRGNRKTWGRCSIHGQGCCVCEEIRSNAINRRAERDEARKLIEEEVMEIKKLVLIKCSSPGWVQPVESEQEAFELLALHICGHCREELRTGELWGTEYDSPDDDEGYRVLWSKKEGLPESSWTIHDLLGTACGYEFWFGEEDVWTDCWENVDEPK